MIEIIENIKSIQTDENIRVKSNTSIYSENFYFDDIYSNSRVNRFVKSVMRMVRQSEEYSEYIAHIHSSSNYFNKDNFLSNITSDIASIEIHHYPITLYELIEIILMRSVVEKKKITSFDLAKETMLLHAENKVGLIPLCVTNHELAHSNILGISKDQIFGDYEAFVEENEKYVSICLMDRIEKLRTINPDVKLDILISGSGE